MSPSNTNNASNRGYLVPIGGAEEKFQNPEILDKFVDICGGKTARIAIIPTASELEDTGRNYEKLFRKLGRGAFGSVYLARCLDRDPRRDDCPPESVALKILGSRRGKASELLKRELSAMLALQHDRIPRVYDWTLDGATAFVVIE